MAGFFDAQSPGGQVANISLNTSGGSPQPGPPQGNSGLPQTGSLQLGGGGGIGGATSHLNRGASRDVQADGRQTTGNMPPRLP